MPSAPNPFDSARHGWLAVEVTDELTFATLDLDDESPDRTARVNGWLDAILRGFHQSQPNEGFREEWLAAARADRAVIRGAWATPVAGLSNEVPVATFGHLVKTMNAGAETMPAWMITDVTVAPTHRRRGLMRRLMTENLEAAVAADVPAAVLTASEGAIYQRFGFGPATRESRVRVETSSRFRLRERADDGGQVAIVPSGEAWPFVEKVFARHHELTRGSVGRPGYYESWVKGYDWEEMSEDRKQRIAVRLDADGAPDGFVVYAMKRPGDVTEVAVRDLVSATPAAHLALWQFLADIDLAEVVTAAAPVVDHLTHALVNHRVRRVTAIQDHLWVRILDLVVSLEARPWFSDDSLVLRVEDSLGHADGTVRIDATGGRATIASTSDEPDVTLDVETLGTLYLGDVSVDPLAQAGRISGSDEALRRFAALADGSPSPHCSTHF
ncbi:MULTISPECIES: GNAT family N-acetyltransferase [unclassified Knoellia]|uniref:GNAT family N-acetyltransferase n=1 Tax=Knoellia altitudinis TaxID=3404795 RepID=UPI0036155D85